MKHPFKRILSLLLIAALLCGLLVLPVGAAPNDGTAAPAVGPSGSEESASPNAVIPSDNEESALPSGDGKVHLDFEQVDDSLIQDDFLAQAAFPEEEPLYADTDSVRVSIVLESAPAIDAGLGRASLSSSEAAQTYRARLEQEQAAVQARIETDVLAGQPLDVCWNFTLGANLISANVPYGKLDEISAVPGVKQVVLEAKYEPAVAEKVGESDLNDFPGEGVVEPQMAVAVQMNGTTQAWDLGYTGAGTRIAIIDTGLDTDHQSFDPGAYEYAIAEDAEKAGMTPEAYAEAKHFLTVEEIESVLPQLNAAKRSPEAKAEDFYVNAKAPFGYNYIDQDFDITHDHDWQGEHGSHVAGIASANRYIPQEDGSYAVAVDAVKVVGNAPDAQLLVMKVAGKHGGIYESDYFAAIEDAVVLKCDVANLSLGSVMAGFTASDLYQTLLDSLAETDMVVTASAGNNGAWADHTNPGALYTEDVNFDTVGAPGSYANTFTVASVDNDGVVNGKYFLVGDKKIYYNEPGKVSSIHQGRSFPVYDADIPEPLNTRTYIVIDGFGKPDDYTEELKEQCSGNIALVSRGEISFAEKAAAAEGAGCNYLIVYNNEPGSFSMDISNYHGDIGVVSISQEDGLAMISAASKTSEDIFGETLPEYVGTLMLGPSAAAPDFFNSEYKTMSDFSSFGVPGNLSIKPEITAPGGNIYSVNGADTSGTAYETMSGTSMAAPQVAGMTALLMQYIRENNLTQEGLTNRALAQSLLMSTAVPILQGKLKYYSVNQQGAGLCDISQAISSPTYVLMDQDSTNSWKDGKVKAELGDDPNKVHTYSFIFTVYNTSDQEIQYGYSIANSVFTQAIVAGNEGENQYLSNSTQKYTATLSVRTNNSNGDASTNIIVPANGWCTVTASVKLGTAFVNYLNEFQNGMYVEGYLRLRPRNSESAEIASHYIPFLAFYGSWSDASMFDKGSHELYSSGDLGKQHYVATYANTLTLKKPGYTGEYYALGNPVVADKVYYPERNSWNCREGNLLKSMHMTLIRNVGASQVTVKNQTQGITLLQRKTGKGLAAFSSSYGMMNTDTEFPVLFSGEGLENDTLIEVTLDVVPEYYISKGGAIDWDALGRGCHFTVPLVIDNISPQVLDVSLNDEKTKLLIRASDNRYVAGALLYNYSGSRRLAFTGSNQNNIGETVTLSMDISKVNGDKFLLQIVDYAQNVTTYLISEQLGTGNTSPLCKDAIAFDLSSGWFSRLDFGELSYDDEGNVIREYYRPADTLEGEVQPGIDFYAATDANGMMYATDSHGNLYAVNEDNLSEIILIGKLPIIPWDLAYDRNSEKLYAVTESSAIYEIDASSLQASLFAQIPFESKGLTIDGDGYFYAVVSMFNSSYFLSPYDCYIGEGDLVQLQINSDGKIEGLRNIWNPQGIYSASNNLHHNGIITLAWNSTNNNIYWSQWYEFVAAQSMHIFDDISRIDLNTGKHCQQAITYEMIGAPHHHLTCLVFPDKSIHHSIPYGGAISSIKIPLSLTMIPNEERELTAEITPWNAIDSGISWFSSDDTIASVDQNGRISAHNPGVAVVSAISDSNPDIMTECKVIVTLPSVMIAGIVQNSDGTSSLFSWNFEEDESYRIKASINRTFNAATKDESTGNIFAIESVPHNGAGYCLLEVDPATGNVERESETGLRELPNGLSYLNKYSTNGSPLLTAIGGNSIYSPFDPRNPKSYSASYDYDYTLYISSIAMGTGGTEKLMTSDGMYHLADMSYVLDESGVIWKLYMFDEAEIDEGSKERWKPYFGQYFQRQDGFKTNIPIHFLNNNERAYYSICCDQTNGTLFLASYDGFDTQIWRMIFNEAERCYDSTLLGTMEGVGPVSLYDGEVLRSVDKSSLEAAVTEAEAIADLNAYTEESAAALTEALAAAKTVLADENATQEEVDAATEALLAAMAGLTEKQTFLFDDVQDESKYYFKPVYWAYNHDPQITAGTSDKTFGIKDFCTRAQIVTFLYAAYGKPEVQSDENPFTDVKEGKYYYKAVLWALENGISTGKTETTFGVKDPCTRAQAVTFLWKAAGSPEPKSTENPFTDVEPGKYYYKAVLWAVENGITSGTSATTFGVKNTCTRAQTVTFLYKALVND